MHFCYTCSEPAPVVFTASDTNRCTLAVKIFQSFFFDKFKTYGGLRGERALGGA